MNKIGIGWKILAASLGFGLLVSWMPSTPTPRELEIARLQREVKELAKKAGKESLLYDGVHDTRVNGVYTVQGDCVWSRRLEDRERLSDKEVVDNGGITPLHHDEQVRVIEIRRHIRFGKTISNWSRVQSLETPGKTPVWIFNEALHN
jgi:hypothetical protein